MEENNVHNDFMYWEFPEHIPKNLIELFLKESETLEKFPGYVGNGNLNEKFRKVTAQYPGEFNFMAMMLHSFGMKANMRCWQYEIYGVSQCDLLTYEATGDKYDGHVDTQVVSPGIVRKLTAIAFLNDDYEGGRFYFMHDATNKQYIETKPGSVVVFPCHIMHGVEPVTAGERKSIVTWLVGPPLK